MGVVSNDETLGTVVPVVFAAVGAYFGGNFGASAGWLIGSWLFGEEADISNNIIDPGVEELPRANQALRGATMAILFGTNRVHPHIVWQNNWNFIRHESWKSPGGGGGKAGGSGGAGGKAGAGKITEVEYEYKWDLIYHLGMTAVPYNLFAAWIGPDRVGDDTLRAIVQEDPFNVIGSLQITSLVELDNNSFLRFEDAFFYNGFDTTNENNAGEAWDHFETVVGLPHRFPSTVYIGYKQLNLGGVSAVPQLSFEIGPGQATFDFDSAYINQYDPPSAQVHQFLGQDVIEANGLHYYFTGASPGSGAGSLVALETGLVTDEVSSADLNTLAHDAGLDVATSFTYTSQTGGAVLNKKYVLLWANDPDVGVNLDWAFVLCTVNTSGVLVGVGGWQTHSTSLATTINHALRIGVSGEGTDGDDVLIVHSNNVGAARNFTIQIVPSINDMLGPLIEGSTIDAQSVSFISDVGQYLGEHQSSREYDAFSWIAPKVDISGGIPTWSTRVYFYIGKADVEADNDDPVAFDASSYVNSNKAAHPNGWFAFFDLGVVRKSTPFSSSLPTICGTDEWVFTGSGETILTSDAGLSDAGENRDETVDDNDDYLPAPFFSNITSGETEGLYIFALSKSFTGSEDLSPTGTFNRGRFFLYNPLSAIFEQFAIGEGSTFDTVSDAGVSEGNRFLYTPHDQILVLAQNTKTVFEVRTSTGNGAGMDDDVQISKFGTYTIGGGESVPCSYIIHEILSNPIFGIGIPLAQIDDASYNLANNYCRAEGFLVSTIYNREQSALKHIELLLSIYGGFLIDSGGIIKFGIQNLGSSAIRTIDNDHLIARDGGAPVSISLPGRQQTYNKVKINYIDRLIDYKQNHVEINDEVDQDLYGIRAREFPGKFVMTEALANKMAIRTLWGNLYAKDIYDFKLGPKDADLEPGDVITLVDSHNLELQSGQRARIVMWQETGPMIFNVKAVKEIEYINTSTLDVNSSGDGTRQDIIGTVRAPADFNMYELPKEFQGANPSLYVGWNALNTAMGANLYLSADGISFAKADQATPYIISGIMTDALPVREPGWMEENVQVYLFPDTRSTDTQSGFTIASPTYVHTHALDDVSAEARGLGGGVIIINSEAMSYQGVNLIAQNHYRFDKLFRGWGGTHIQDHSSGDLWTKHGGGIFVRPYNEDKIGTVIHYKVSPMNFAGVEYDIASIDARTYTIQGTYFSPQVQPSISTFVESLITGTASDNLGGIEFKHVHSSGTAITFTWPDAARIKGYGAAAYGLGTYGRFTTDTTSHNWRVEVLSSDGTVVRCITVDSGFFVYSADINSTDFTGWQGAFSVRVTPFNDVGDALRNRTKKLVLFEQV